MMLITESKKIDQIVRDVYRRGVTLGIGKDTGVSRAEAVKLLTILVLKTRINEQKHSKRNGYVVSNKLVKVNARINKLEKELDDLRVGHE